MTICYTSIKYGSRKTYIRKCDSLKIRTPIKISITKLCAAAIFSNIKMSSFFKTTKIEIRMPIKFSTIKTCDFTKCCTKKKGRLLKFFITKI